MSLRLKTVEEDRLIRDISKLLAKLADVWDPGPIGTDRTTEVSNEDLQEAARLSDELSRLEVI